MIVIRNIYIVVMFSSSGTRVVCQNLLSSVSQEGLVQMAFDNAGITFTEDTYQFVEDPEIVDVSRHKAILSGGLLVNVFGTNLDSVQNPKMYVNHRGMESFGVSRKCCKTNLSLIQEFCVLGVSPILKIVPSLVWMWPSWCYRVLGGVIM